MLRIRMARRDVSQFYAPQVNLVSGTRQSTGPWVSLAPASRLCRIQRWRVSPPLTMSLSYQKVRNKCSSSALYTVLIRSGGTENNTLASYDSCFNDNIENIGYLGDQGVLKYLPKYLGPATARLQRYAPKGFTFNYNDTYAMQSICSYETAALGGSDFCKRLSKLSN